MTNFTDQWAELHYSGSFEDPESGIRNPESRIQNPESRIQDSRIPEFQNSRIQANSDHLVAVIYT